LGANRLLDVEVKVKVDGTWHPGWLEGCQVFIAERGADRNLPL
jgi:hypothetical protein